MLLKNVTNIQDYDSYVEKLSKNIEYCKIICSKILFINLGGKMQLVLDLKSGNKIDDVVEYILNSDNRSFNEIIRTLKNPKGDLDIRYQREIEDPECTQQLATIADVISTIRGLDKEQYTVEQKKRIGIIGSCRGQKDLQKFIKSKYGTSKKEAGALVAVLTGEKNFIELIEEKRKSVYEKRSILDFFRRTNLKALPEGNVSLLSKYSQIIGQIVREDISFSFPIQNLNNGVYEKIQTLLFEEREEKSHQIVLGKDDEDNWQINPELKEYVYQEMPKNLTPEEQAVWTYMKLCKTFSYDDKQVFDTKNNLLNKEFLEKVKPGDAIVCFDFSRIYAKFINEDLKDSLEAKVIGGKGHFLVELIGQDSFVTAEATSIRSYSNEFFKMRMGLPIEGIRKVYDPNNKYSQAIEKITPLVNQDIQSINSYMSMLNAIREQEELDRDVPKEKDTLGKISALVKTMEEQGIRGTEAMMGIMTFASTGFLGKEAQRTWIKQNVQDKERGIEGRSAIVINNPKGDEFYVINSHTMSVESIQREEIIERFNDGKYEYKDSKHTIEGIKDEVPIPEDKEEGDRYDVK